MANLFHLARRFFGSIKPGPPESRDEAWALRHLNAGETALWKRMSNPDRRHAVQVANDVGLELGHDVPRPVIAAALLHDVGKIQSGLRTPARVVATIFWAVNDDAKAVKWQGMDTFRGRLSKYRLHPEIGAELLAAAGSNEMTISWARNHHRPGDPPAVDPTYADVLRRCDND